MRKSIDLFILVAFVAVLAAPVIGFATIGAIPGFEQRPLTAFPAIEATLRPAPEARAQLADAIFERSAAKREAVRFRNRASLSLFGAIETDRVVSGAPGWLFVKGQFERFDCARHSDLRDSLRRFILMAQFAEANDVPVRFAIAPNKASAEREAVRGRAAIYAACYDKIESEIRSAIRAADSPVIIDHLDAVLAARGDDRLYMKTDTHWTRATGVRALAQLARSLPEAFPGEPEVVRMQDIPVATDLWNGMLVQKGVEPQPTPVLVRNPTRGPSAPSVLLVHDSFYRRMRTEFAAWARDVRMLNRNEVAPTDADLSDIDYLVVERVERVILERAMRADGFGWTSPIGRFLFRRAAKTANAQCDWSRATNALAALPPQDVRRASLDGGTLTTTGGDPQAHLPPLASLGGPCVAVDIELPAPGVVQLFISTEDAPGRRFTEGASIIRQLPAGRHTVRFIMPPSARGRALRFDPAPGVGAVAHAFRVAPQKTASL